MTERPAIARPPEPATIIILGFFTAGAAALLAWLTLGDTAAIVVGSVIIALSFAAPWITGPIAGRIVVVVQSMVLAGALLILGVGAFQLFVALTSSSDAPAAAPTDPVALASADAKITETEDVSAFRLELDEAELNALLQDALGSISTPFRTVTIDILNRVGEPGRIAFVGEFKSGSLDVEGVLGAEVEAGDLELTILEAGAGIFTMPGAARDAVEDMIGSIADLETALAAEGADVQDIVIGDELVIVTGVNRTNAAIDAAAVVAGLGDQVAGGLVEVDPPGIPPGRVSGNVNGPAFYVALGDSLAAGVGVDDPRFGYVSRFHGWYETERQTSLGVRNYSIPGESSGSLLAAGQLDTAVAFAEANPIALVTLDIGANDLLGHLATPDCSDDAASTACADRIDGALAGYEANLAEILDRIAAAAPDAEIVFLTTYNPFSFGFEKSVEFEALSNDAVRRLNAVAAAAATQRGIRVADGFGPMRGTVTVTTHMVDESPDIHPNAVGYDVLTGALVAAVS